ncbi:MAG: pyruvate formate lyase family protein, partial [Chitinophagales bacterium]
MKTKTLADVLKEKGISLGQEYGGTPPEDVTDREVQKSPSPRAEKLRNLYYNTYSSVSMEFPYWYTRVYSALDGEVPVVRRAAALKAAFSHLTPMIFPGEKLVMGKTLYYRGSFPMPWLSCSYYVAKGDELTQVDTVGNSADELVKWGQGGGNVTRNFGKVVSIAGKFGIRQEEVPALLKVA